MLNDYPIKDKQIKKKIYTVTERVKYQIVLPRGDIMMKPLILRFIFKSRGKNHNWFIPM